MSLPRYDAYKESGLEWLGAVPAHWAMQRLKRVADVRLSNVDKHTVEGQGSVSLCNYLDVYRNDHITCAIEFMQATASAEQIERLGLCVGDCIITKDSEDPSDIGIPAYVKEIVPRLVCGYHLALIRPDNRRCIGLFLHYLFQSDFARSTFEVASRGLTRYALGKYPIDNFEFPVPPIPEQAAIAGFLDRETTKIDALVEEQQRLVALLKEKQQAVTSHAVTKGLDPNAPMKDSGVEWLGEVPARWQVKRLRHISPQLTVGIVVEPSKYYREEGVPALRSLNVRPGRVDLENIVFISEDGNELQAKSKLRAGDLVAVRTGQPGTAAVIPAELDGCNCIDLIIIRRPSPGISEFLCWYLASDPSARQFSEGSGGAIQQHFNVSMAADLIVAWPPMSEQQAIVEFLDCESIKLDRLVAESENAMILLQERRSALISSAVTGKIDVRGLVPATAEAA